ncbi:hypothetical protein MLD38_001712 [Melastoma candidum]|uniref:Uncharacterized protein n=1 Tax=Melastoma candidum TaxID=119954 RepID=A0ACB9SDK3_9MYRT|nr:hypothetical protein MLD38_001712 [Melastoma candidum]
MSSPLTKQIDDDGRVKRTGTWLTACAHLITAVLGSGVLSLAWAVAQLGWIAGPAVIFLFSAINYCTSVLLCDCYRSPDPVTGTRNYTYGGAVKNILGGRKHRLLEWAQYTTMVGISIGFTITASLSMVAVEKSNCFHKNGHEGDCSSSEYWYIAAFALIEIILSQIPRFHNLTGLSVIASTMSFIYAFTGLGLAIARVASGDGGTTSLTGVGLADGVSASEKVWRTFSSIGNIAFSFGFCVILVEIQDTLKSSPPENKTMKKACAMGGVVITLFYGACGMIGYAAFGNKAPGNLLTGFGFYEPFWLVDLANICVAIHIIGSYQVLAHPLFSAFERWCSNKWPESKLVNSGHAVGIPKFGIIHINYLRLTCRTTYVIVMALVAMIFPFFNAVLGLIGVISFWPLAVYFPIDMYIVRTGMPPWCMTWTCLKLLTWVVLAACLLGAAGSFHELIEGVQKYKPFAPHG